MNAPSATDLFPMPFSAAEFAQRRDKVIERMRAQGLDAIVITSTPNYYYLSGLPILMILGLLALVITKDGRGYWVGRRTDMGNVKVFVTAAGWSEVAREIADEEDGESVFAETVARLAGANARVGFELGARSIASTTVSAVLQHAPGISAVNISGLVEGFRAVKSEVEIECLRQAGKMTAAVHREAVSKLVEGQTDSELATNCFAAMARLGSDPLPLAPLVVAGPRSALAHATYANIPIRRGEMITIEIGAVVKRYCAPAYRIAMVGQPSDEIRRFHDASRDALLEGLAKIGPGMTSHEADRIVRDSIARSGYLDYFTVRAAYSVGLGFVPSWDEDHIMKLRPNDERIVQPGMVFHLVPALYKMGVGAACCSNTICVTENGVEALVPIEPELLVA